MVDGVYNPGQLVAVREIKDGAQRAGFDTAVFSGAGRSTITQLRRTPTTSSTMSSTVTDVVGPRWRDRLTHIERLQFADEIVDLVPGSTSGRPVG